jgi:hypothetical protein
MFWLMCNASRSLPLVEKSVGLPDHRSNVWMRNPNERLPHFPLEEATLFRWPFFPTLLAYGQHAMTES